jgi:hypothetical protein
MGISMSTPQIEAQIIEIQTGPELKPYFNVRLHAMPHRGELIHLYSMVDEAAKKQTDHYYEVVEVLHKLYDVPKNLAPDSRRTIVAGTHLITVLVKPSTSNFFD